jgi:hypothetical protein
MPSSLPSRAAIARERGRRDLPGFVSHCLIVEKESGALIPFALWPEQADALAEIDAHEKLIMPKGRQIGATWLELAAMLHAGTFHGHRAFSIARQSQEYAQDAIVRLLVLAGYDPLSSPPHMRVLPESPMPEEWRPKIASKTTLSITFENGSSYRALTATQQIGRGLAAYWGLADELAFWPWPAEQIAAMESGCSRLHIISTGNGEGDFFHSVWKGAVQGKGDYFPLFVPSTADPRRDDAWYRRNVDEAADEALARREHARSPEEAFRPPEGVYFSRFERVRNVVSMRPVNNWRTYRSFDFGWNHPAAVWIQISPQGQPFVVAEFVPAFAEKSAKMRTAEFVENVLAIESEWNLAVPPVCTYGDPAGTGANPQTGESEVDVVNRAGLAFVSKPSSIRDGCVRLLELIADPDLPLMVSDACPCLITSLGSVRPDRSKSDLYDQSPTSPYQHILDSLRYWAVNDVAFDYDEWDDDEEPTIGVASGMWGRQW